MDDLFREVMESQFEDSTDSFFGKTGDAAEVVPEKRFRMVGPNFEAEEASSLEREFLKHVRRWRTDTVFLSSTTQIYFHPSYQRIIGLGKQVLPYLFRQWAQRDDDWFWALKCITGSDPVPRASWGDYAAAKKAWLRWAARRGFA